MATESPAPSLPLPPLRVRNLSENPSHMWHPGIPGGLALPGQVLEVPEEARAGVLASVAKGHVAKETITTDDPISLEDMIADEEERERQRLPGNRPAKRRPVTASLRKK